MEGRTKKKNRSTKRSEKGLKAREDFDHSESLVVRAKKRPNRLISIRLPINMIDQLRKAAEAKGDIGYQQMIKAYIAEGLIRDAKLSAPGSYFAVARFETQGSLVQEFWSPGFQTYHEEFAGNPGTTSKDA